MNDTLKAYLSAAREAGKPKDQGISNEFLTACESVSKQVEEWGTKNRVMKSQQGMKGSTLFEPNQDCSIETLQGTVGADAIAELVAQCGIPECHRAAACERVAAILAQVCGRDSDIALSEYRQVTPESEIQGKVSSLESLYGSALWNMVSPGTEAFGIGMNKTVLDLRTMLTVGLLQFSVALTPRIVPIQSTTQSNVTVKREMALVYDMSKPEAKPVRALHLFRDPSMVSVKAVRIVPLAANDAGGEFLAAEDKSYYQFRKEFNLFKLSLIAGKDGWDKVNHTDLIEDNIKVDGLLVKVTTKAVDAVPAQGTEGQDDYVPGKDAIPAKTEVFKLPISTDRARLTQIADDYLSTERRLALDFYTLALNADSVVLDQTASEIFADIGDGKSLVFKVKLNAHVDRKTGDADADCWFSKIRITDGSDDYEMVDADTTFLAGIASIEPIGFSLDARYNEDNRRKSSIRIEINTRTMSYELPSGRNFFVDSAIGQEGAVNAAARIAQFECLGRDGNNLNIIARTMDNVHDMRLMRGNGQEATAELAATYAAGDLVNQIVVAGSIDFAHHFIANASNEATADIKQFVKFRLNKFMASVLGQSLISHQLASGSKVTFRMITSPYILGAILQLHHIREHLDRMDQAGTGAVQYVISLDCGVNLEVVTTDFDAIQNKMLIIPFFEAAPQSVFNFGQDWDQGTLVGTIPLGADNTAAHNRLFSVTREALIPTNVVGALLTVTNMGADHVDVDDGVLTSIGDKTDLATFMP